MLYKEFASALVMSLIIVLFAFPLDQLAGDARIFPALLLVCMGVFNAAQYFQAWARYRTHTDSKLTMKGYPLWRVAVVFALTLVYLWALEVIGFYPASLVFFVLASLIAQPAELTWKLVALRVVICGLFVGALYLLFTVSLAVQIPAGLLKW